MNGAGCYRKPPTDAFKMVENRDMADREVISMTEHTELYSYNPTNSSHKGQLDIGIIPCPRAPRGHKGYDNFTHQRNSKLEVVRSGTCVKDNC